MANQAIALGIRAPQPIDLGAATARFGNAMNQMAQMDALKRARGQQDYIAQAAPGLDLNNAEQVQSFLAQGGPGAAQLIQNALGAQKLKGELRAQTNTDTDHSLKMVGSIFQSVIRDPSDANLATASSRLEQMGVPREMIDSEIGAVTHLPVEQRGQAMLGRIMQDPNSREAFKATLPDPQQANLGSQIVYIDKNPMSATFGQKVSSFDVQMTEAQRHAADIADRAANLAERNANRAESEMVTVETANGTMRMPKYAMGGGMGGVGAGGGGSLTVDRLRPAIVAQESHGDYTLTSPQGALGAYQIMPDTARTLAGRAGLPWRRDLMTSNTPEAKKYQDTLGNAAIQEAISAGGGDLATTAMYYHGGSNRAIWGPKTRQYAADIANRMGGAAPAPAANAMPAPGQIIPGTGPYQKQRAQEQAKSDVKFMDTYPDIKDTAAQTLTLVDKMIGDLNVKNGKMVTGKRPPHPGFEGVIGAGFPGVRFIPGTDAAAFDALLKQVEGKEFLQAYNSLRGTGSITEIEGQKATDALSRMKRSVKEEDFVAAAREFQAIVRRGIARADARAAKLNGGGAAPAAGAAPKRMKYDPVTGDLK